jgi:hypothetical protein
VVELGSGGLYMGFEDVKAEAAEPIPDRPKANSMFLPKSGIYRRVYVAPKPRTKHHHAHCCEKVKYHTNATSVHGVRVGLISLTISLIYISFGKLSDEFNFRPLTKASLHEGKINLHEPGSQIYHFQEKSPI